MDYKISGPVAVITMKDAEEVADVLSNILHAGNVVRKQTEFHVRMVRDALYALTNDSSAIITEEDIKENEYVQAL